MKSSSANYKKEDSEGNGFASGLFLSVVIGACAALLWAPKSGQEQR